MSDDGEYDAEAAMRAIIDDPGDEVMSTFVAWLVADSGPDDWHLSVMGWNWDAGEDVLRWIVGQRRCDRATALLTFWNAQPEYFLRFHGRRADVAGHARSTFDLIDVVRSRWRQGFYTRGELSFGLDQPYTWPRDFAALKTEFGDWVADDMPEDMRGPLPGRALAEKDMIEGIPARFWPAELR